MKVGFTIRCPEERREDPEVLTAIVKMTLNKEVAVLLKKSIRVVKWNMQQGYNGDDFIQNMFTISFTGKGYKIPRIIKKMLLK